MDLTTELCFLTMCRFWTGSGAGTGHRHWTQALGTESGQTPALPTGLTPQALIVPNIKTIDCKV
ncbi:hypothetical protein GCM10009691_04010 [Brevibacterium picturae]|uniref:Uncharacterized protein n=1 Tax=Brevibacterium picturae TaxID=260553 RepID=A0ABN2B0P1_9MICO